MNRRDAIKRTLGSSALLFIAARPQARLIRKAIPSSGEQLPVIGLGSAGTFSLAPTHPEYAAGREVIRVFHELGGRVIDTAPSYGLAEEFVGATAQSLRVEDELFLATKVNVGPAGQEAAKQQMENSSRVLGKRVIDLMQVWNLGDTIANLTSRYLQAHIEAAQEWKAAGRCRYIGITTSRDPQYADVEAALRRYQLDFVQLDYSIADRLPEERLLPLARERGVAVIANRPFATGGLFRRVAGRPLPEWAADFDAASWAHFFLKFIVSHPAVTCVIPATGNVAHLRDNMGAGVGRLPDAKLRTRMIEFFATL